jgi:hypothetical protein
MALPTTDAEWVTFLTNRHDTELKPLKQLDAYYEGTQPLTYMHPDLLREVSDRIWPVIIFWPQLVVDAIEERLDVEGFRLPDEDAGDDDLWRVWQDNDLDEESQLGRVDALVMKRSYLAVGTNEDDADTPLVTVESPREVYAYVDPRTRKVLAALRRWQDDSSMLTASGLPDVLGSSQKTLYLPNSTIRYDGSKVADRDDHNLGAVPMVPLVNRARTADRYGRSELSAIVPLADAACKIATDMMVAAEFHALPLRALFGVGPADIVDQDGNAMSALQAIMGRLLAIGGVDGGAVKPYEFSASSLSNFHDTLNQLANLVAALAGLDPAQLGVHTDMPASADAIRAREARLVKRAERKQVAFGGAYEETMRLVRRFQTGDWDPRLKRLETIWRDASTPTVAQAADAAVKLYSTVPRPIVPLRMTRQKLGFTEVEIERMEDEDDKAAAADPLATLARMQAGGAPEPVAAGA